MGVANGDEVVHTPKRLIRIILVGILMALMQASVAEAARKGNGACGEYRYRHNGACVDARGAGAGPPAHWHPYDPSNSIH